MNPRSMKTVVGEGEKKRREGVHRRRGKGSSGGERGGGGSNGEKEYVGPAENKEQRGGPMEKGSNGKGRSNEKGCEIRSLRAKRNKTQTK